MGDAFDLVLRVIGWGLAILGGIAVYELIRALVLRSVARRVDRSVRDFLRGASLNLETYRFASKIVVIDELLNDPVLNEHILAHAEREGERIEDVRDRVEGYLDEIVPAFNILAYFQVGLSLARFLLETLYEVVVDREDIAAVERLPPRSVVIFVANHRSNMDYVLVPTVLARHVALSYAVGEWARVWPLEHLFKSFGSYFVRRGFRDELYHTVLRRYVQHISARGLTQGIFLEGGLSRDGKLRDAKIGLLDYLIQLRADPSCDQAIVFVPVGINFDWVLEDTTLLAEHAGQVRAPTLGAKLASGAKLLLLGPFTLAANAVRLMRGRMRRHGYATARVGEPVLLDDYLREHDPELPTLERDERLPRVKRLADHLMSRIADEIPVTPVPLVCAALLEEDAAAVSLVELRRRVHRRRDALEEAGVAVVMGRAFGHARGARERIADERAERRPELVDFEEQLVDSQESELIVRCGLEILERRRIVENDGTRVRIRAGRRPLIAYYANSLDRPHHETER